MASFPEPDDVGPVAGGHLRASHAQRDRVRRELATARDDGRLSDGEFAERDTTAASGTYIDDLVPLIRDLADPADLGLVQRPAAPLPVPVASTALVPTGASQPDARPAPLIAILGAANRRGVWNVPDKLMPIAVLGETKIDFTHAVWPGPEITIVATGVLGEVRLIVPADVEIDNRCIGCTDDRKHMAAPSGRRIIIKGIALLAEIHVVDPKD